MTAPVDGCTPAQRWGLADRRLYLCTPDRPDLEEFLHACILGGVDIVQLRDKTLDDGQQVKRAALARRVCVEHHVPFILNDRPDLAVACGADGVHIGQNDSPSEAVRTTVGPDMMVGLSTHAEDELARAVEAPVDYLSAGPVVPTPTKPGRPGTGLAYIQAAVARAQVSVWITGGVSPDSVRPLALHGARHFVVVRYLTEAEDPGANAAKLRSAIDEAIDKASD